MSEEKSIARELQERINDFYFQNKKPPERIYLDSINFILLHKEMQSFLLYRREDEHMKTGIVTFSGIRVTEIKDGILLE